MAAMILIRPGEPLRTGRVNRPLAGAGKILIRVSACGVCRTDLHIYDGDLSNPKLPLILGHEIVGTIVEIGSGTAGFEKGQRVGVPWLGGADETCEYCLSGRENLCENALFTGYTVDGGYAEYAVADYRYCFGVPDKYSDSEAAPLYCAGLIGYRALRMAEGKKLGFYGFGAAAHIIAQIAIHQGREIFAFTRPGDREGQAFARSLGASWAGTSSEAPPEKLDSAIIFAPVGSLVPAALQSIVKGGTVVCAGIHMTDIPSFPYRYLWEERKLVSVANLTRRDALEFLKIVGEVKIRTEVQTYPLARANDALSDLREGKIRGAAVLQTAGMK